MSGPRLPGPLPPANASEESAAEQKPDDPTRQETEIIRALPRKTLHMGLTIPNEEDYARWWESERVVNPTTLSYEDILWKTTWESRRDNIIPSHLIPNPTTSASWIEPNITFILRLSIIDQ
jgi:hypothetical protein